MNDSDHHDFQRIRSISNDNVWLNLNHTSSPWLTCQLITWCPCLCHLHRPTVTQSSPWKVEYPLPQHAPGSFKLLECLRRKRKTEGWAVRECCRINRSGCHPDTDKRIRRGIKLTWIHPDEFTCMLDSFTHLERKHNWTTGQMERNDMMKGGGGAEIEQEQGQRKWNKGTRGQKSCRK